MHKKRLIFIVAFTVAFATSTAGDIELNERSVFLLQSKLSRLTPTPHMVSEAIARLCTTSPSPALLAKERARSGPHMYAFVNLYVSDDAIRLMDSSTRQFLEGTIVLKEKLSTEGSVVAVGGMIKRPIGFDPDHNDWEYFYAEKGGALSKGRLPNCIRCHAKAKSADYVYTIKRPPP